MFIRTRLQRLRRRNGMQTVGVLESWVNHNKGSGSVGATKEGEGLGEKKWVAPPQ